MATEIEITDPTASKPSDNKDNKETDPTYTDLASDHVEVIDHVHFESPWSQKASADGWKFQVRFTSNGGLVVWGENKTTRHQFETVLTEEATEKMINNNAISPQQFFAMLCEALTALSKEKKPTSTDASSKEELAIDFRLRANNSGVMIAMVFTPSRFMKLTFLLELPSKKTSQTDLLAAQIQDIWSWKRSMDTEQQDVIVGKWTANDAPTGTEIPWITECLNTNKSFQREENNSRIRLSQAGLYKVECQVLITGSDDNHLHLFVSGIEESAVYASSQSDLFHTLSLSDFVNVDADAWIELTVTYGDSLKNDHTTNRLLITKIGEKQ